jgi:DNA-binding LacI/PurR family transcriptional regulator
VQASDRVTIADVAGAWGVGIGTVSRVINGGADVRQVTRSTVLKVIEQLGYLPSHLATALSRGTSRTVVIVMSLAPSPDHLMLFRRASVPLVTVDVATRGVPHTVIDDVADGRLAAEHLLALGHARIGFVGDRARRGMAGMVGHG